MKKERLKNKAKILPTMPGCYLMKNKLGAIIYVGKAKNLRARVRSYFNDSNKTPKTEILVGHIDDFDFILTDSDSEAFILENNLIKEHSPKYNIMLKDDKSYPYVVVNRDELYPRLRYERRVKRRRGVEVFGPFAYKSNISEVLRIIIKSFNLRDCSLREFKSRKTPCLLHQIKQCSAPCVGYISKEKYEKDLDLACDIFKSRGKISLKYLEDKMHELAEKECFEHAAIIRDQIKTISDFIEYHQQTNVEFSVEEKSIDIIAWHVGEIEVEISFYIVRNGILLGHKNFNFPLVDCSENLDQEIANYLFQYYSFSQDIYPDSVVIDLQGEVLELFSEVLKKQFCIKVRNSARKYKLIMKMTKEHAKEHQRVRILNKDSVYLGLDRLKNLLGLKERPINIECYDVAVFQGASPAAAQITFRDGRPDKRGYRHYHLQELVEGNNDFKMLKEVLSRRIKHGKLPDLFVVDGGKGQVNIFLSVLKEEGLEIPVVGIAKRKSLKGTEERLIIPGRSNPYILNKNKSLLQIMVHMRDEAHRFSRRLHHHREKVKLLILWPDKLSGISKEDKEKLKENLALPINEYRQMNALELIEHFNISKKVAEAIVELLQSI